MNFTDVTTDLCWCQWEGSAGEGQAEIHFCTKIDLSSVKKQKPDGKWCHVSRCLQEKLKLCTFGMDVISLEEMSQLFGKEQWVVTGSCMNAASSVMMEQSASPGDNKSQPMDQLCCIWQYRWQLHLDTLACISSDSDELSYSTKVHVLAEKRVTVDVSLLYKKKILSFNHDQGKKQSWLANKQDLSILSWELMYVLLERAPKVG